MRHACLLALLAVLAIPAGPAAPAAAVELSSYRVAAGLTQPLFALAPPGDPRLFILERQGRIRILEAGVVQGTPFLDIRDRVGTTGEGGLLGFDFAPDFATSGEFYVYYTDEAGDSTLSRFAVSAADPNLADPTETVILVIDQPSSTHNGGTVAFGPDGFLYLASGDGGGGNDPDERAQDPTDLLGKMLRIDVGLPFAPDSVPVPGTGYAIPVDNPFAGDDGVRDEIWAFGLRNPYRFAFDPESGDLWIADVGQNAREEIDVEPAGDPGGRNWGWDVMEGSLCNPNDPAPAPPCNDPSLSLPFFEYPHSGGNCSITGGFPYRGREVGELAGHYFYGDFCTGRVWTLDPATGVATDRTAELGDAGGVGFQLVGFGRDAKGELYVMLQGGEVHRILRRTECNDGVDNDGDGAVDFPDDPGCAGPALFTESPACDDGVDNDGDGAVDLADPGCRGNAGNLSEGRCGQGAAAGALLAPLAALGLRRRPRRR